MTPATRETRIFLALWRKAYTSGEPIVINAKSPSDAMRIRMALYNAIKPYRVEGVDDELRLAGEALAISTKANVVTIGPRVLRAYADDLAAQFGILEDDLITAQEREAKEVMEASLARLMEQQSDNPFYKNEER